MTVIRKFIVGTDWWTDCDDAVALRVLSQAINSKKIELLGICVNACMNESLRSIDTFMVLNGVKTDYALDLEATDFGGNPPYQKRLADMNISRFQNNFMAENPVKFYRKKLSEISGKADVLEIGYTQVLAALLDSEKDEYSNLSGVELINAKVNKLWIMAGKWDKDGEKENNLARNMRAINGGMKVLSDWPTPITFLGWETGNTVITGSKLDKNDVLYKVLCDHGSSSGRSSWDPMLMDMAIIGSETAAGYTIVRGVASLDKDGYNYFSKTENGNHFYVKKHFDDSFYSDRIDDIIKGKVE